MEDSGSRGAYRWRSVSLYLWVKNDDTPGCLLLLLHPVPEIFVRSAKSRHDWMLYLHTDLASRPLPLHTNSTKNAAAEITRVDVIVDGSNNGKDVKSEPGNNNTNRTPNLVQV